MELFSFAGAGHRSIACKVALPSNWTATIRPGHARADITQLSKEGFAQLVRWTQDNYPDASTGQRELLEDIMDIQLTKMAHARKRAELAKDDADFAAFLASQVLAKPGAEAVA